MPPLVASKENVPPPQQTATDGAPPEKHTVCRFLIKNLQGGGGHAKAEYRIDLVTSKHGLLDMVVKVFEVLQKEKLTADRYSSHLWSLTLAGTNFENGWRSHHSGPGSKMNHLDEEDIRLLKDLAKPLADGQKGRFSGESAKFDIVVEKAVVASIDPTKVKAYPKLTAVKNPVSSKLEADWLSNQQQADCAMKRAAWIDYYQGDNVWKRDQHDHRSQELVAAKPEHGRWSPDELEIMGLLMKAGCKFKKSWKNILEFALVDRAETSASGQWYKLQKATYHLDYIGRNKSNEQRILLAKRLAKSSMETFLENAVPKLGPHPWEKTEAILRKRGWIDDTMSSALKKQKICMHHFDVQEGLYGHLSDDES